MKKWRGNLKQYPQDPDIALARQLEWSMGPKRTVATASYPEPCNLTAAAAWHHIPEDMIATDAIIYYDLKTKLWVQAVGIKLIPHALIGSWIDLQLTSGAVAAWINTNSVEPRRQIGYIEEEINVRAKDLITYTHVLNDMGKYIIKGVDVTKLFPDKFKGVDTFGLNDLLNVKADTKGRIKGQFANSKCILTPQGAFISAMEASKVLNIRYGVIARQAQRELNGYRYIGRDEYLGITGINNTEQ